MLKLDVQTMLTMITITNLVVTGSIMFVAYGRSAPGLRSLSWALLTNLGIYGLFGMQGMVPDFLSIALPNAMGSMVIVLMLNAICRFRGINTPRWMIGIPPVLIFLLSIVLHDRASRIAIINLMLAGQEALVLWALLRDGGVRTGRGRHIITVSTAAIMGMFVYRTLAALLGIVPLPLSTAVSLMNTITYLVVYLGLILVSFGFVLMVIEHGAEENRRLAMEDGLTGLPNRRAVLDNLRQQFSMALRSGQPLSILMLDIDFFKQVNDRLGHPVGDVVLRNIAASLRQRLRGQDLVGRFGGEEFLAVLPNTSPDDAFKLAESLRQGIAESAIKVGDQDLNMTVSIGLCGAMKLDKPLTEENLIGMADNALYAAKEGGRNKVVTAPSP